MNLLKNILGRIFALWALILFLITLILVYIPMLLAWKWSEPKRTKIFHRISRIWMGVFLPLTGVILVRKGKKYFKTGETFIILCNHNTLMDVPITTPGIPGPNKTIAKIEMTTVPLFGMMYKLGSVIVDRKSEESRKASFGKMKEVLKMGLHMCIYPEGTRNKTNRPLQPFHDGAFRLAVDTGHALLPTVLFNTAKALPNNKIFYYWPTKIEMHFLEPVPVDSLTKDQLKEKVFTIMSEYYTKHKH